jgi:parallel beta-helix repeat protein
VSIRAVVIMLLLVILSAVVSVSNIQLVGANSKTLYVDDDNISGPWDGTPQYPYQNITSALEHAFTNDTIFVHNGTYIEKVRINKSVSLVGENKQGAIIDGNFTNTAIFVTADDVNVTSFTIRNAGPGYPLCGVCLENSTNSNINSNIIIASPYGIRLTARAHNNTIADNQVFCPPDMTGIGLSLSDGNTIINNTISSGYMGINPVGSNHNMINGNVLHSNWYGIRLTGSNNNTIVANEVFNNTRGIHIASYGTPGNNNLVYHNDFINNTQQATESNSTNIWHNGYPLGGNFWSNYNRTDFYSGPYQNETGSDGIGDTPYIIPDLKTVEDQGQDNYPLMKPLFWWNLADVNYDFKVDLYDAVKVLIAYGSEPDDDNWNPHCDIAEPYGKINLYDAVLILVNYGKKNS